MKIKLLFIILFVFLLQNISYANGLSLSGQSYILVEENSGRVLTEKNSQLKMPIASTTKIMTALIALEKGNLDEKYEITEESTNVEGSSIYLKLGEHILFRDLIYGLMLRSGNDSAVAIANYISGSESEFVKLMNIKAKQIGANNTNFVNPHGLHDANHYSTAYDLALITRKAFSVKGFDEVSRAKTYKGTRVENNYFVNKNKTLWEYKGGDGVKIGYTTSSGRCLVSSASKDNMRLIAVSLRAGDWFNDNYKLLDYGFENFKLYNIYDKNQLITQVTVTDGAKDKIPLVSESGFSYPLQESEKENLKLSLNVKENLRAPIIAGQVIGDIEVYLDGKLIKKDNLVAKYDIEKKSFLKKYLDIFKSKSN